MSWLVMCLWLSPRCLWPSGMIVDHKVVLLLLSCRCWQPGCSPTW